jgi:hypothetical protein
VVGVPADLLQGLVQPADGEPTRGGVGAAPFEKSSPHHPGAEQAAGVDLGRQGQQRVVVVPRVPDAGDAGREVERTVPAPEVGVDVAQAGEEGTALPLDDLGACFRDRVRPDADDLVPEHHDGRGLAEPGLRAVEDPALRRWIGPG